MYVGQHSVVASGWLDLDLNSNIKERGELGRSVGEESQLVSRQQASIGR